MRASLIVALCLGGCSSVSSPLDILSPDELTIGHGRTTGLMNGGYTGHNDMFEYESEAESTYAALTWDIPSFKADDMTREERHAIREANLAAAQEEPTGGFKMNIREGVEPPPAWAIGAIVGSLALFFLLIFFKSRRSQPWS